MGAPILDQSGLATTDKAQIRITFGDRSGDGKADIKVEVYGKLPFVSGPPNKILDPGPANVPVEEALKILEGVCKILPPPAAAMAQMIIAVIKPFLLVGFSA